MARKLQKVAAEVMQLPPISYQVRAGRALLNWSIEQLSLESGVSSSTIKRVEGGGIPIEVVRLALCNTLYDLGVEFIKGGVRFAGKIPVSKAEFAAMERANDAVAESKRDLAAFDAYLKSK
jgi:transcriptional regulator with XRE-family HTH domain